MDKKLTIGLFTDNFFPAIGGTEMVVHQLATALTKLGHNVYVVAPYVHAKKFDANLPYNVIRFEALHVYWNTYAGLPAISFKAKKQIQTIDFDVINTHSNAIFLRLGIKVAKQKNIPVVSNVHTNFREVYKQVWFLKPFTKVLLKNLARSLNKSNKIITICKGMIKDMKTWPCNTEEIKVIRNATEYSKDNNYELLREEGQQKLNLNKKDFMLLFVGRLEKYKNIQFTLEALSKIKDKSDFRYVIVGDGEYLLNLKNLVKKYDLESNVIFFGKTDHKTLEKIYARADVLTLTNVFDNNSLTILESATFKTPTIVLEGSSSSEEIIDKQNGFCVSEDVDKYADFLLEIKNSKGLLEKVSNNAKETLSRNWEDVAKQYLAVYYDEINKFKNK